jgi:hypothetical protein
VALAEGMIVNLDVPSGLFSTTNDIPDFDAFLDFSILSTSRGYSSGETVIHPDEINLSMSLLTFE